MLSPPDPIPWLLLLTGAGACLCLGVAWGLCWAGTKVEAAAQAAADALRLAGRLKAELVVARAAVASVVDDAQAVAAAAAQGQPIPANGGATLLHRTLEQMDEVGVLDRAG